MPGGESFAGSYVNSLINQDGNSIYDSSAANNPYVNPFANPGGGDGTSTYLSGDPQNSSTATPPSGGSPFSFAGNLVGVGVGAYEFFKSQKELNALNKIPYPNYTVSPELRNAYNQAQSMSNQGFSSGEKAGYQNNINQQNALSYHNALQSGGGSLANDISAGINSGNVNAQNQFAINDAQLRRQNMAYAGSLAGQIQSQNNLVTQGLIKQRETAQNQWASAQQAGLQSIVNSATAGFSNFGKGGYSGLLSTAGSLAGTALI